MVQTTLDNRFSESKFIVDPSAANGAYTTIQSAINAASSGTTIFIRPATYTENITIKDGVNLVAFTREPNIVAIKGSVSFSSGGEVFINGIKIETNGNYAINYSGASVQNLVLTNCVINSTDFDCISNTNSNAGSNLSLFNCTLSIADPYKFLTSTHSGSVTINQCFVAGVTTAISTINGSGGIRFLQGQLRSGFSLSGTASMEMNGTFVSTLNVQFLNCATGTSAIINGGRIFTGTATAINVDGTASVTLANTYLDSSNAATVTGTGTFFDGMNEYKTTRNLTTTTLSIVGNSLVSGNGNAGQVVASKGANALPNWQDNTSNFVVDAAGTARFTTIQAAINAASSGTTIFIRPGTYTENLTLKDNVNLTAFTRDINTVILNGTITMNVAGTVNISNMTINTNGATAISFTSANQQNLTFTLCSINGTNADLATVSNSNSGSFLNFINSTLNASPTFKIFNGTFTHTIQVISCILGGGSTTASTSTAGTILLRQCQMNQSFALSGTAILYMIASQGSTTNTTFLTCATGTTAEIYSSQVRTGTASALTADGTAVLILSNTVVDSTNAASITGTGTLRYANVTFANTRNPTIATQIQTLENVAPINNGGTARTSFVAYAPVCGGTTTTGGLQTATGGAGTLNQLLVSQGAAALPSWTDPQVAGASLVRVAQIVNGSGAAVLVSNIPTTYTNYIILISNYVPAVAGGDLRMSLSTDNGATFVGAGYKSNTCNNAYTGTPAFNSNSTTYGQLLTFVNTTTITSSLHLFIQDGFGGVANMKWQGMGVAGDGDGYMYITGGSSTNNANAINFFNSAGGITRITINMYGVR